MSFPTAARRALAPELRAELRRQRGLARAAVEPTLDDPRLGVVVTGQQVGLFLGPAFGLHKTLTAIALARRLASAGPTLPLFWLQSEDHDGDEVRAVRVLDQSSEPQSIELAPSGNPRASMADRPLGNGVRAALEQLARTLDGAPFRDEAMGLISAHYLPEASWATAFGGALAELLAETGLVVFDPRSVAVARLAAPVHRFALERAELVEGALAEGVRALEAEGRAPGVRPRADCSLGFFHPEGPGGPRFRLQRTERGWRVPDREETLSTEALLSRLAEEPLAFSTSALLRVVLQQALLPTVSQVAGPSEAHYLAQVPPLLGAFGCPDVHVTPRASFVFTEPRTRARLERLGLTATEFSGAEVALSSLAARDAGRCGEQVSTALERATAAVLDECGPELLALHPGLERALARTRRHFAKGARRLGARVDRARALRDEGRVDAVGRVARVLTPAGTPQERSLGVVHFIAQLGRARLVSLALEAAEQHLDDLQSGRAPRLLEIAS